MQVKLKMLYAATKATLKKAFDSSAFVDEIAATSKVGPSSVCAKYIVIYR